MSPTFTIGVRESEGGGPLAVGGVCTFNCRRPPPDGAEVRLASRIDVTPITKHIVKASAIQNAFGDFVDA
ncbi:hypothetical protein EVAR_22155_1 [Eumeta japonica]|uniref:Uncharacterized protein n=1 Tax=Eumeta variegata TaxID=151549 RepID=A0A4C1VZL0_EUMVA|nr:hypothetical protein EVAR_22155_1 [Eumeta japonica]